jgi:putative intracellular protease/amidase
MAQFKVAIYLYPQADLLDFSGPAEIYCHYHTPSFSDPPPFSVTSFAHCNPVTSASSALVYVPNATFADVASRIEDYDILVIPGAHDATITNLIKSEEGAELLDLIRRFSAAKPRPETGKRYLQSVCTGSLLLAASGVLAGRTVTSHHTAVALLKQIADEAAGGDAKVNVVRQRWVDAGKTQAGVGIMTAGGVSSGIDASLQVVELCYGKEKADFVAGVAEFERREGAWGVSG